jgi:two-component system, OmpR family, response regulator
MLNVLVVDDNDSIRKLISTYLHRDGYNAIPASNGEEALGLLETIQVDMMIVDIMMPKIDGYDLTESLRASNYDLPILMITAKETFEDKKRGFNVGIDDYMVKPIDMNEMLLRVGALFRRAKISNEHKITVGEVILDYSTLSVITPLETHVLPKKEFYLLFKLLSYPKKIFTRQQLMDEIWGMDSEADVRTVDVHIKRLREKLEYLKEFEIVTVRGLGYKAEKRI